jgi:hypothetical protein
MTKGGLGAARHHEFTYNNQTRIGEHITLHPKPLGFTFTEKNSPSIKT